jgi:hypothetical protein
MDKNGWVATNELIDNANKYRNMRLDNEVIKTVVETNDKQRFTLSEDGGKIRANQGHSIVVDAGGRFREDEEGRTALTPGTKFLNFLLFSLTFSKRNGSVETFLREHFAEMSNGGQEYWESTLGLKDTHGIDTSNWPQGGDKNSFSSSLYFRKSNDGLALAINPMGRGNNGILYPDILILQEEGKGAFPIGTWKTGREYLTFTATTVTFRSPNLNSGGRRADYTISDSGDTFVLSNQSDGL